MKLKRFILSATLGLIICMLIAFGAVAQPGNPSGEPDPNVPITGVEILLALGAALGVKKYLSSRKKEQ